MTWHELIASIRVESSGGTGDPKVHDITYDSRRIVPGAVYVAVPGTKIHGDLFIADAIARGASAIVSANRQPACPTPWIQVADPRRAVGELARTLWGINLCKMALIGVTGTNGKTTVAHLCRRLLAGLYGSDSVWMLTTVGYYAGSRFLEAPNTTPESCDVFRLMGEAKKQPAALVMEVSSHALELNRVAGLSFDCAIWTNLTQDHLDFHGTMANYYQAKKKLFTQYLKEKGKAAVNIDDTWGARLVQELGRDDIVTYGANHGASVRIVNWRCGWDGTEADIIARGEIVHLRSPLIGLFNVYNMAAVCAAAVALSIDMERVRVMLEDFEPVAGRLEKASIDADFTVAIDYAHTPDALENVLSTARSLTQRRLFCVFGCGGDRDRTKRPRMAEAAVRHCDEIIITSDNPRSEKPGDIIDEILVAVPLDFPHWVIPDRHAAIAKALELARPGDCVIVAGKGHETYQEINGVRHHFSDRETVEQEWRRRQTMAAKAAAPCAS